MNTTSEGLSIGARIGMLRAGLLSDSQIQDLISDAVAQHLVHYLPPELKAYGAAMMKAGKLKVYES
jgi:hypothetical protein